MAEDIASLKVDYVGINYQYLSQTLYNEFRSKKLGVGAWTVNEAKDMKRFQEMGVDFITSDRPDLLSRLSGQQPDQKNIQHEGWRLANLFSFRLTPSVSQSTLIS